MALGRSSGAALLAAAAALAGGMPGGLEQSMLSRALGPAVARGQEAGRLSERVRRVARELPPARAVAETTAANRPGQFDSAFQARPAEAPRSRAADSAAAGAAWPASSRRLSPLGPAAATGAEEPLAADSLGCRIDPPACDAAQASVRPNAWPASPDSSQAPQRGAVVGAWAAPLDGGTVDGVQQVSFVRTEPAAASQETTAKPEIVTQWQVPAEINVGQEACCRLSVRNSGRAPAAFVAVELELPHEVELSRSDPEPDTLDRSLHWLLGDLEPGESQSIAVTILPTASGSVAPQARVTYSQAAAAEIRILEPRIELELAAGETVTVGQTAALACRVHNRGTGAAIDVVVRAELGATLQHAQGSDVEYRIGTVAAGESRQVDLHLAAIEPGSGEVTVLVAAGGNELARGHAQIEVVQPQLRLLVEGPRFRYVDRRAAYTLRLENPGPAPADNVELVDQLPEGVNFLQAGHGGCFDTEMREVRWFVGRLEPGQTVEVQLAVVPTAPGQSTHLAAAHGDAGAAAEAEITTRVDAVSSLVLELSDADDPVEVDGTTHLAIRLHNQGSSAARAVEVTAAIPAEMQLVRVEGPADGRVAGDQVLFDPLASLEPGQTALFRLHVRCLKPGRARLRASYRTAEQERPVIAEELTQIYAD